MNSGHGSSRYYRRKNPRRGGPTPSIGGCSTVCYGFCARAHPGVICPSAMVPWRSVASRFYRWREGGIWDCALSALQVQADAEGRLDWDAHLVDATIVRAHQHAAGAKKSAGESAEVRAAVEALGYSQGGFSTKVHLRAEGQGKAMVIVLTPGQPHEATVFEAMLEQGAVRRPGRGRPRRRSRRGVGGGGDSAKRASGACASPSPVSATSAEAARLIVPCTARATVSSG